MKESRIVNRAKWLLIEHRHLSETEAHRAIEKQTMDRCLIRLAVAQEMIDLYSDNRSVIRRPVRQNNRRVLFP